MSLLKVATPFNIELEFALAAFHKRLLAWMIDLVLMLCYAYMLLFFVHGRLLDGFFGDHAERSDLETILILFIVVFPIMFYHLLFEVFLNGRSPGKALAGIKVINLAGASATFSQLLLRWILFLPNFFTVMLLNAYEPAYLPVVVLVLGLAAIPDAVSMAISAKGQRLGDLAAGTVLVDVAYRMDISETIYREVADDHYVPRFPEVLRLSDKDINGISNLLNRKQTKETEDYILRVAYRIEEILGVRMQSEPTLFLQTLLKDYNYLIQKSD